MFIKPYWLFKPIEIHTCISKPIEIQIKSGLVWLSLSLDNTPFPSETYLLKIRHYYIIMSKQIYSIVNMKGPKGQF